MAAPDEKAREIYVAWKRTRKPDPIDLVNRITAALIEARRAALEEKSQYASVEAASWAVLDTVLDLYRKHGPDWGVLQPLYAKAARLSFALKADAGALIPTHPDDSADGK